MGNAYDHQYTVQEALDTPYGVWVGLPGAADDNGDEFVPVYARCYVGFYYSSYYIAETYNYVLWGTVGFIMLAGAALRLTRWYTPGKRLPGPLASLATFYTKHLVLSSTVGTQALEPVSFVGAKGRLRKWTTFHIPARLHGLMVSIFVAVNIILLFTPYDVPTPNLLFVGYGYNFEAYLRHFADRTAVMAFGSTPLIYLLASRNNPISWFTGASYSTLMVYHRWVARITALHVILHSIAWIIGNAIYSTEELAEEFSETYWRWGVVSTVACIFLVAMSFRRLREISYGFFLVGHIIANIFYTVGAYYHVYLLDPKWNYLNYIYSVVGIWAIERLIRLVGMLWINTPSYFARSSSSSTETTSGSNKKGALAAEGYLVGTGSFMRLRLCPSTAWPKALGFGGPGSYVFISSPDLSVFESHPFTIAWPTNMPSPSDSSSTSISDASSSDDTKEKEISSAQRALEFDESPLESEQNSFELILKSYDGYTKRLAKKLADGTSFEHDRDETVKPLPVKRIKLIVEGPYGEGVRLEGYESVIVVAGGSGISATVAHLADLAKRSQTSAFKTQRITVVWAIRQTHAVDVLIPYLIRLRPLLPTSVSLAIHIYYTGETRQTLVSLPDEEKPATLHAASLAEIKALFRPVTTTTTREASPFCSVVVRHGRPDVGAHVDSVRTSTGGMGRGERIALSACGPSGLCDGSREAVKARLGGKDGLQSSELVYHEEAFTW